MEAIRHVRSPTFAAHQLGSFSGGSGSGSDVDGSPKPRFMRTGSMASFSSVGAPGEPSSVNPSALDDLDTMILSSFDGNNAIVEGSQDSVSQRANMWKDSKKNSERDEWFQEKLQAQVDEYTMDRNGLKVVVATLNCNSKVPSRRGDSISRIYEWLHLEDDPDVIAVGLQEVDMSPEAMIKQQTEMGKKWLAVLQRHLLENAESKYVTLAARQMVGLMLLVFIKNKHVKLVRDLRTQQVAVGAMNAFGNKGGVGCHFYLGQTSFCFITVHLAAHKSDVDKRNQNFHDIKNRMTFGGGNSYMPEKHDYLFWFGDLNYRIEGAEDNWVKQRVKEGNFKTLLRYDQLTNEKEAGRAFWGFEEATINFAPTYKYDPGTLNFDVVKPRTPSYTDRVLYKGLRKDHVVPVSYKLHRLLISDHLPVALLSQVSIKEVVEYKFRQVFGRLVRQYNTEMLGAEYNDESGASWPEIELSSDRFEFSNVKFDTPVEQVLTITNKSHEDSCEFQFVPSMGGDQICKPWLTISKTSGTLLAGQSIDVTLTVRVDRRSAHDMTNYEDGIFNESLCIHIENGGDYIVTVSGKFLSSHLCYSLTDLVCMFRPVRHTSLKEFERVRDSNTAPKLPIPKELWYMVDYIKKYGMRDSDLFQSSGSMVERKLIREHIDLGKPLDDLIVSIHSVIDCLMDFLDGLPEPIIPQKHYKHVIEYSLHRERVANLLAKKLHPVHLNVWNYMVAFLRELLLHSDANRLTADALAHAFSNILIPSPKNMPDEQLQQDRQLKVQLIKRFVQAEETMTNNNGGDDPFLPVHRQQ